MTDNKISSVRFRRINEWVSRCTFIAEVLEFQLESSKHSESHQIQINRVQFILQWYNHMRSRDTGDSILNANQLTPYAGNSLMFNLSSSNVRLEILLKRSQKNIYWNLISFTLCVFRNNRIEPPNTELLIGAYILCKFIEFPNGSNCFL